MKAEFVGKIVAGTLVFLAPFSAWSSTPSAWIVMIPGAASSGDQAYIQNFPSLFGNRYFGGYQDALSKAGMNVLVCPMTRDQDTRTIEEREDECAEMVSELPVLESGRDVVLFGHSMGGLIARVLAWDPRVRDRIKSVVLLSTPNQGTVFSDFIIDQDNKSDESWNIVGGIAGFEGFVPGRKPYLPELKAVRTGELASTFMAQDVPDNLAVGYFSVSTSFDEDQRNFMEPLRLLIANETAIYGLDHTQYGARNDGVVPEYSQIYGAYIQNLEINHVEAACPDSLKWSPGCLNALSVMIPLLESQAVF
jgi:pimeloyl-ACP methyl ester carboxylesterase